MREVSRTTIPRSAIPIRLAQYILGQLGLNPRFAGLGAWGCRPDKMSVAQVYQHFRAARYVEKGNAPGRLKTGAEILAQ
jgi:hypothetical protein